MQPLEKLLEDKRRETTRREKLEAAWDVWLSTMNPSHIGVFSFSSRLIRSPKEMFGDFRTWLVPVDSRHGGKTPALATLERSPTGRLHLHFLLFGAPEINPSWLKDKWTYGNRNWVKRYDPAKGYGTTYTMKETLYSNETFTYIRFDSQGATL